MILDEWKHADFYLGVHPLLKSAFDYLRQNDLPRIERGRHEIDGERMLLLAQQYLTKPREEGQWEAHRKYMDVQYVYRGIEWFGWANRDKLSAGAYDAERISGRWKEREEISSSFGKDRLQSWDPRMPTCRESPSQGRSR